jgi:hypothetical protein
MVYRAMRTLLTVLCCVLWAVTCYAQGTRLGPLGAGLTCNPAVYNQGNQPVTADCPITPQLFVNAVSASCTINSNCVTGSTNDSARILVATVSGMTFTLPPIGANGTAGYSVALDPRVPVTNYNVATGSSAVIYGCGPTAAATVNLTYPADLATDGTNWQCSPYGGGGTAASSFFPNAYLAGLIPSNDTTTPTVIGITKGQAADDTNVLVMTLGANFTKSIPGTAFVAGSGGSCQDVTGPPVASTWYYLWLVSNAGGTNVDVVCSTAALSTGPALPTGYTLKRWIGEFATNSSSQIRAFRTHDGNLYYWAVGTFLNESIGTTQSLFALDVPLGVNVEPLCRVSVGGTATVLITSPFVTAAPPGTANPFTAAPGWDLLGPTTNAECPVGLVTNLSGQIGAQASVAATTVNFVNRGWRQ